MSIFYLSLAIVLEVTGTLFMKASDGLTKAGPVIGMSIFYVLSFTALALALKKIDVSVAYAIWSGLGTALIVFGGMFFFKEVMTPWKAVSILLIIAGVVGLRLSGSH